MRKAIDEFLRLIRVVDCEGFTKMRLGNWGDGGYVVLRELLPLVGTLHSYGIGNDVGFELDFLAHYPATAELYDPTIEGPPLGHSRFNFHRRGVGFRHGPMAEPAYNDMLKMDVEWSEWEAITTTPLVKLAQFSQIVMEIHILHVAPQPNLSPYFTGVYRTVTDELNLHLFTMYRDALTVLHNYFYCYHVHANNSLPLVFLDGRAFPPLLEMSWVRNDLVMGRTRPAQGRLPVSGLDAPNKKDRPDIINWYPLIMEETCSVNAQSKSAAM